MITLIEIKRFKAIREAALHTRRLNLFAGVNSMGKSSVIQSLLLLRQSHLAGTLPDEGLLLRGQLVDLGRGEDVHHQLENEETISFGIATETSAATWLFDTGKDKSEPIEVLPLLPPNAVQTSSLTTKGAYDAPPFAPGFRYLSAERVRPEVAYETSFYAVRELDQIGPRGEYAAHYLAAHGRDGINVDTLIHSNLDKSRADLLANTGEWLAEICPGVTAHPQQFPTIDKASVSFNFSAGVTASISGLRATNVGFGLTYALPIIVATLASKVGDVLIVENPESHLHPRGQVQLAKMLALAAAGGIQVFVETHSDHILNGIRLAVKTKSVQHDDVGLFYFSRDPDDPRHDVKITSISVDRHGKINPWPNGFFDDAEKILFKLL